MLGDKRYILLRDCEDWVCIYGVATTETTTSEQIQNAIREFKEAQWAKVDIDPKYFWFFWWFGYNWYVCLQKKQDIKE